MSASEIIEQIKELAAHERAQVARFVSVDNHLPIVRNYSISEEADGLPVIRATGGIITSETVREIESLTS